LAVVDQKERYRRRAVACYEIAATLTGERASSMVRLGDTYAALAAYPDRLLPNPFRSGANNPQCPKCGQRMRLAHSLPRTDFLPAMQAFHCEACGETLIWKGQLPSSRSGLGRAGTSEAGEEDEWITRYVAVSFCRAGENLSPGVAVECPDATTAMLRAELMIRDKEIVGAVAFSRRGNSRTAEFEIAVILGTFGEIPEGFDIA